jgi:hypothetical protein
MFRTIFYTVSKTHIDLSGKKHTVMSILQKVKRFFANTIHGYAEVFSHRYVDYEVVSRKLMCDIKAFGKEIMDVPDETDIHKAAEESEVDSEHQIEARSQQSTTTTFNTPVFESDLDINLDSFNADEFLSGFTDDDDDESLNKKGYDYDSDFKPEVSHESNKRKNEPQVKWNGKRFKRVYTVESFIDFTQGQTRTNLKLKVNDENLSGMIQKVASEGLPIKDGDVFYKCARNWKGTVLPGLVVSTRGHFFVIHVGGVFRKPVSMKDRFLYHDSSTAPSTADIAPASF